VKVAAGAERAPDEPALHAQPLVGDGETTDSEDDETVNVQLVVLAVVGGVVFLLLPLGYLLRRRLGLTAYTPPAESH
jgi:hypothetical protein